MIIPFRIEDAQPRRGLRVRLSDLHWLDGFVAHERAIEEPAKRFGPSASATVSAADAAPAAAGRITYAAGPHSGCGGTHRFRSRAVGALRLDRTTDRNGWDGCTGDWIDGCGGLVLV